MKYEDYFPKTKAKSQVKENDDLGINRKNENEPWPKPQLINELWMAYDTSKGSLGTM